MDAHRPVTLALPAACLAVLCGCGSQPDVLFTATRDNAAVLGLTDTQGACEAGARLAYLTNEMGTLRGCWVRSKTDIRASFAGMPEIRIASQSFRGTEQAERRNLAVESFEESPLYAVGSPAR